MTAQSSSFSTDANAEQEHFRDRTHSFDTDIRWWINFQEIQIQMRRHYDHDWLHWKGHCDQQSYRFLKLTPLLQVSLVTRRFSPVVVVIKMCVASWSGWFRTALFRFSQFITSRFLAMNTLKVQMQFLLAKLLPCYRQTLPFASSYVSGFPCLSRK